MANDKALGGVILAGSAVGIVVYGLLLWFYGVKTLEVTAFLAMVVILGVLGWIGFTMMSTPKPQAVTPIPPAGTEPEKDRQPAA